MDSKFLLMKAAADNDVHLNAIVDELLACGKIMVRLTDESVALSRFAAKDLTEARMAENHNLLRILILHVSQLLTDYAAGLEERIRSSPAGSYAARQRLLQLSASGMTCIIALTVLAAAALARRVGNRLSKIASNCELVARGERPHLPMEGDDEISEIDRAFHTMHGRLLLTRSRETAAINHSANAILTLNGKLQIEKVNDAVQSLWGYKPNEVVGENITAYLDAAEMERVPREFAEARLSHSRDIETVVRTAKGSQSVNLWTVGWSSQQEKFFLVAQDISELKDLDDRLKESERRMQLILARMPAGLILADENVSLVNAQAESILGYETAEMVGKPIANFIHGDGLRDLEKTEGQVDVEYCSASGELVQIESVGRRLSENRILIILTDGREKNELMRARLRLSALIVEDIEEPLKEVSQSFQILLQKFGEDALIAKPVNRLAREATRLVRLFGELVNSDALERGSLTVLPVKIKIHELAVDAQAAACDLAAAKKVEITCNCQECTVLADPDRVAQILTNLLSNAIKFSPTDSMVELTGQIDNGRYALSVSDKGPGIPEEMEEIVFMPFKQVKRSDAYKLGGSGMGLSICRQLARQMGGELIVQNNSGAGCTFSLVLPLPKNLV